MIPANSRHFLNIKISNLAFNVAVIAAGVHFLCIVVVSAILAIQHQRRNLRVLLTMMAGLYIFWIIVGGFFQQRAGPAVSRWAAQSPKNWRVRFFLLCIAMGMVEEGVTTAITNSAPLLGVSVGEVYITASSNYLDVILGHSLIVLAPAFLAWVWLLSRYQFNSKQVLLLFGLTGTLMEMIYGGAGQFLQIGMWVFVYGLMVYLPSCMVPAQRAARVPRPSHYVLAVFAPFVFLPLCIPLLMGIRAVRPAARTEFPPIILSR